MGDPEDAAFARFLASLPTPDASLVADLQWAGEALGRHVYAKPIVDEPLPRALRSLAGGLRASGLGELIIVDAFNRAALIGPPADAPAAMGAYIDGVLAGFLSECFNCEVLVTRHPDGRLEAALGGGRDVNRRARP